MPLMHKESQKAFKHNVKEEMEAHPGKRAQNLAIAYAIKRKAEKEHEAQGGEMHMCSGGGCEHPSHKMAEGGEAFKGDRLTGSKNARTYSAQSEQKGVHTPRIPYPRSKESYGESMAGYSAKDKSTALNEQAKGEHERVLSEMKSMPKPKLMAEGGEVSKRERALAAFRGYQSEEKPDVDGDLMPEAHKRAELQEHVEHMDTPDSSVEHAEMNQEGDENEGAGGGDEIDPFVMKIMMGRAKGYSKGGQVANEDSGESSSDPEELAKSESNEFDELGKSGGMNAQYHGSEELGDEQEDEDRDEIVSRVMKSRSKRDRMAVSGEGSTYGRGR